MYAPKFRSWMSDEERFQSALEARIAPLLEDMRAEGKQMLVKAEEDLRLRPTKEETDLQMYLNQAAGRQAAGLCSYYNAHQKLYGWQEIQLQNMQSVFENTYREDNNWGFFK